MAMTKCRECSAEISDSAKACPKCGAKVPRTKWWLWIPLGLIVAFFGFGLSVPEYKSRAIKLRNACEKLAGSNPISLRECERIYDKAMAEGQANR
jgi:hypothetical protein